MLDQKLEFETIECALECKDEQVREVAAKACIGHPMTMAKLGEWAESYNWAKNAAAIYASGAYVPEWVIEKCAENGANGAAKAAIYAMQKAGWISVSIIRTLIEKNFSVYNDSDLNNIVGYLPLSKARIWVWTKSYDWHDRYLAMAFCKRQDVPYSWLLRGLMDGVLYVREAAVEACKVRHIPVELLWKWYYIVEDEDENTLVQLMKICQGRDDASDLVEMVMLKHCYAALNTAAKACKWMNIPLNKIYAWHTAIDSNALRAAAMYASIGRADVPNDYILEALRDESPMVRDAALEAYVGRDLPPLRSIKPPAFVYARCINGVVAKALIPNDAFIRKSRHSTKQTKVFRADKAKIVDIIGNFYGEKVGISCYDPSAMYRPGDEVFIEDFYLSQEQDDNGFHFYLTELDARKK